MKDLSESVQVHPTNMPVEISGSVHLWLSLISLAAQPCLQNFWQEITLKIRLYKYF